MGDILRDVRNFFNSESTIEQVISYVTKESTEKKEDYQIAISQDGKFAVTFDTGKK
jgi:hypothetical protein